jgi:hypothetical protein
MMLLLLLLLNSNLFSQQTFKTLRGIEDSLGNTHLFYHAGENSLNLNNNVYHFDLHKGTDSILFYAGTIYISLIDFEFWDGNPSNYILISFHTHGSSGSSILKYNGAVFGGNNYIFEQIDISRQNSNLLYVGGQYYEHLPTPIDYNFVLKSTDAGESWNIEIIDKYFVSLNPFNDTHFFALDEFKRLLKTTNSGLSFTEVDTIINIHDYSLEVLPKIYYDKDSVHFYRVSKDEESYYLSVSDSVGEVNSWQVVYRNDDLFFVTIDDSVSGTVYLTDEQTIYYSTDYAQTFSSYKTLNNTLVGIYKKPNTDTLYTATSYSIYEVTSSSVTEIKNVVSVDDEITYPGEYLLSQNYPNPFNPTTKIKYQIPNSGFVTLKVYDLLGREVATLVNEEKPVGSYEIKFNGSHLSSGIYFYKLQAGDYTEVKKMTLMR